MGLIVIVCEAKEKVCMSTSYQLALQFCYSNGFFGKLPPDRTRYTGASREAPTCEIYGTLAVTALGVQGGGGSEAVAAAAQRGALGDCLTMESRLSGAVLFILHSHGFRCEWCFSACSSHR